MKHKKLAVLVLHVYLKQGNINIIVFETALKIPRALDCRNIPGLI